MSSVGKHLYFIVFIWKRYFGLFTFENTNFISVIIKKRISWLFPNLSAQLFIDQYSRDLGIYRISV